MIYIILLHYMIYNYCMPFVIDDNSLYYNLDFDILEVIENEKVD